MKPPFEQVNIRRLIVYCFIPVLNIYAFYRIQKFWASQFVGFGWYTVFGLYNGFAFGDSPDTNYVAIGNILLFALVLAVNALLLHHWAVKYNEKVARTNTAAA